MRSLIVLEAEILKESVDGVKNYLEDIDRKTANDAFRLLGEHLGLTTMEIEGIRYAHLSRASQIMGYANESGLRKLMSTYQITTPKIGWFVPEVRTRIRNTFDLDEKDSQATLMPYTGILLAGMSGMTDGAKKIKLYLLEAERVARIGIATLDQFKYELLQIRKCKEVVSMAATISRMDNGPYKDAAVEYFEKLTGKTFPKSVQLRFPGI